ncbi:MAG TPA: nickel-binding protein [Gammaproteobacteria bacterium]
MTTSAFLERTFDEPLTPEDVFRGGRESAWCFDLHRVDWHGSFLSHDGRTMICRFSALDLESVRLALRERNTDMSRFWSGTVYEGGGSGAPNVVVERSFASPVRFEDVEAHEQAKAWCLEAHRVAHVRSYFSLDGKRMLCFYQAPDAEAVRIAQREAAMPVDAVWGGVLLTAQSA